MKMKTTKHDKGYGEGVGYSCGCSNGEGYGDGGWSNGEGYGEGEVSIYHVRPSINSFMDYMEQFADSRVLAFLKMKDWEGESDFPTFRSFEALDKLLKSYGTEDISRDPSFPAHVAGCIGPKYGAMFVQFIKPTSNGEGFGKG